MADLSTIRRRRKYGFVCPRFGEGVIGGEVTLIRELASHLVQKGNPVEIMTTCAKDNRTWENEYPEGKDVAYGINVSRFKVDERDLEAWIPRQINISEGMNLDIEDQLLWMQHSVNSSSLYRYILQVADDFDALFFIPYLFGTTFWGSLLRPDKSYLIPCLHDESYAYTDVVASMFRQVSGAIFNAEPEQELANRLYGTIRGGSVGMGFEPPKDVESLTPYFEEDFPYIIYVGRKETGKNVHLLIDYFIEAKDSNLLPKELKLVVAGGGSFSDLNRPQALERGDVIDVERLSETDKRRLIKHSVALCQPSCNESFSIVLMEAWLLGVPVIVNADCEVTRYQVKRSGGGLYFCSAKEFGSVTNEIYTNKEMRNKMAEAGKQFVLTEYAWDAVIERFDKVMDELLGDAKQEDENNKEEIVA